MKKKEEKAVVEIGGHQYLVSPGEEIIVDRLPYQEKEEVLFDQVLLVYYPGEENKALIGNPVIEGLKVKAVVKEHFKGKKLRVARFKAKSRYRRVKGFRPELTRLEIKEIVKV